AVACNQSCKPFGLAADGRTCRGGLFDECRVLLCHRVQSSDGLVDSAEVVCLGAAGIGDLGNDITHLVYRRADLVQGFARLTDQLCATLDLGRAVDDQRFDLSCRGCTSRGQSTHFTCYNCESPAMLAGACRFHRCIQCQQIRLEGDVVDDAD